MLFYIHPINPHYAASHADDFFAGWQYGIWRHPHPALEPSDYEFQAKHLEAAQDTKRLAEEATPHLASIRVEADWLTLPSHVGPHSAAAVALLEQAVTQARPVRWPWAELTA